MPTPSPVSTIDLTDPGFRADPYPVYARLRREAPVVRNEAMGYWLVSRYTDVAAALRDPAVFSNDSFDDRPVSRHSPENTAHAHLLRAFASTMIFKDPPEHTRLRTLVNKAFTPRQIERRREDVDQLCRALLGNARSSVDLDFVRDFAAPFPILVIAELLGVPVHDRGLIKDLSYQFGLLFEPLLPPTQRDTALDGSVELGAYLDDIVEERRRTAAADLISALVAARRGDDQLTPDELRGMLLHLLVAGNETSTSLITHTQLVFEQHPHIKKEIAADPGRAGACVEEVLRFNPPLQMVTRQLSTDIELRGVTLARGDLVGLLIGAAHRDDEQFADADRFDMDRPTNTRHLAFGAGPHFCLGSVLSRLEGETATRLLADEFGDLTVFPDRGTRRPDQMIRGYLRLPARFTDRPR